jgi:hypothetical protein
MITSTQSGSSSTPRQTRQVLPAAMSVDPEPTKKRVDDDVAAIREIQERVLEHGGRLDCRIVFEASSGVGAE